MKTKYKKTHSLQLEPRITGTKSKNNLDREERSKSVDSQKSRRKSLIERQGTDFSDKPSPLDFDAFLPWICAQWQCRKTVTVKKVTQEAYKRKDKRCSSTKNRVLKLKLDETDTRKSKDSYISGDNEPEVNDKDNVAVKSVYDTKEHLIEVMIIGAKDIPRKLMKAISVCLPFHPVFTRITIRGGGVSSGLLHEIGALLPPSNITDICLDNCLVPEGNFYVLLDHISQLRNLFLNHCHINDEMCDKLVSRIEFGCPGSSLLVLDLGSNCITDVGAKRIGQVLRMNRVLLHLNLSDNKITNVGAAAILSSLAEFRLSADEIIDMKKRKLEYARNSVAIYKKCFEEVFRRQQRREMESSSGKKSLSKFKAPKKEKLPVKPIKKTSIFSSEKTIAETAEKMTKDIVGDFVDPFDSKGLKLKDESYYGVGNLTLCSLSLAYNMLEFETIKKIYEVLKYQHHVIKEKPQTGLMRISFDGNKLPVECIEYHKIDELLRNVIYSHVPVHTIKSPMSARRANRTSPTT